MGLMAAHSDQNQCSWKAVTPSLGTYKVICAFCNPECPETLIFDGSVWYKIISVRFSQRENTQFPIHVTELGMVMLVRAVHPLNAQSPIHVTESGITVLAHPCIRRFVLVSMMALQLFRESYTLFSSATIILVSSPHPINASSPIHVTDSGILMLVSASHPLNASAPISVTEFGMLMLFSA